ncbi:MAG: Cache 3/Cache 2 fusion domain-containing protein, partial [Lachnospiraceae bacterium]|nr:Cache 3/Cache 2 fusion domain-containing protein [Lachnospiraceae bacterium]
MSVKKKDSHTRTARRSLNGRILRNTTLNILILVIICCVIMAFSMQSLANNILLDSLQPMARQSAKTVEANIHMLADRMMTIAADSRMTSETAGNDAKTLQANRKEVLTEAAEIYELHTIGLYSLDGRLLLGINDAPEALEGSFFDLLKETDNMTTNSSTIYQGKLGITMGMPVKEDGKTAFYVVGVYKYDALNDVIGSINIGRHGTAYMVNQDGVVTGHPDQSQVLNQNTLTGLNDGNEESLSHVTSNETGAIEFPVDGKKMLVAFSPIRGTQWSLVIQIPKSDYGHFINASMLVSVLATLAVLIVSILVVLRLAVSISRPVKNVTSRMVALSDGDLHTETAPIYSGDELEVLTKTLSETIVSVNRYISDIQQVLT